MDGSPQRPVPAPGRRLRARAAGQLVRGLARLTPWVEDELLGLRYLVRPGDVCIDVGAAAGLYTAELSRLVGATGVVHSVEPLEFLYTAAVRLGLRRAANIRCHPVALGGAVGAHPLRVPLRNSRPVTGRAFLALGASGVGSNAEFDEHLTVPVHTETLTEFSRRIGTGRVDFIKADVEGAELGLLKGGRRLLERYRPHLLLEIEQRHLSRFGHRAETVVDWLAERGYRMFTWQGGGWRETGRVLEKRRNYLFSADDR